MKIRNGRASWVYTRLFAMHQRPLIRCVPWHLHSVGFTYHISAECESQFDDSKAEPLRTRQKVCIYFCLILRLPYTRVEKQVSCRTRRLTYVRICDSLLFFSFRLPLQRPLKRFVIFSAWSRVCLLARDRWRRFYLLAASWYTKIHFNLLCSVSRQILNFIHPQNIPVLCVSLILFFVSYFDVALRLKNKIEHRSDASKCCVKFALEFQSTFWDDNKISNQPTVCPIDASFNSGSKMTIAWQKVHDGDPTSRTLPFGLKALYLFLSKIHTDCSVQTSTEFKICTVAWCPSTVPLCAFLLITKEKFESNFQFRFNLQLFLQ